MDQTVHDDVAPPRAHGPRHPLSAALMILAAIVDGRASVALAGTVDGEADNFRFVTSGDFELEVRLVTFPGSNIQLANVEAVVLPDAQRVEVMLSEEALDDVLLPLIAQGVLH